jgi:hypothetical protein
MRKVALWALAVAAAGLTACSGSKQAKHGVQSSVPFMNETTTGVVTANSGQQIAVYDPDHPTQQAWYQRMPDTVLERAGQPVNWTSIAEGTPVRVVYEPSTGAEHALRVEVLTGAEATSVREKVQGQQSQTMPPPPPPNPPAGDEGY